MLILCVLDHISMYGDVVTIYGSAPQSESSYWLGEQHYEIRLSATVRPIDRHNSLMWGKSDLQRKKYTIDILIFLLWNKWSCLCWFFFSNIWMKSFLFIAVCICHVLTFEKLLQLIFILKLMFEIIGEHLILRRNFWINSKKRLGKTLPDAILFSIAVSD